MKKLRFCFILAMVFLIRVMVTIAIGRHVDPLMVYLGALSVVSLGLLITLRIWSVNKELDERLKILASVRENLRSIERVRAGIVLDGTHAHISTSGSRSNTVTPITLVGDTWVEGQPIAIGQAIAIGEHTPAMEVTESKPSEPDPPEPEPESRLARVLKDNYPL